MHNTRNKLFLFVKPFFEFGSTIKLIVNGKMQRKSKTFRNVGGETRVGPDVIYSMVRQLSELIA